MLSSSATFMDNFFNTLDLRKSKVFLSIIQLVLITHLWLFEVSKWKISSILSFPCPPLSIYTAEKCAFPTILSILQGNKNTVWEDLGCLLRLCSQSDFCIAFFFFPHLLDWFEPGFILLQQTASRLKKKNNQVSNLRAPTLSVTFQ